MNNIDVYDLICCPNCVGELLIDQSIFLCNNCNSCYREKEGILILISKELEDELRK